jgi:hypothetical protein
VYNVFTGDIPFFARQTNTFWRGTRMNIQWSNYTYFPLGAVGAPPFLPDVLIDVLTSNNDLITRYGPVKMNVSSFSFNLPYTVPGSTSSSNLVKIKTYVAGLGGIGSDADTLSVSVLTPQFQQIVLTPASSRFLVLGDIQAVGDDGLNKLSGATSSDLIGTPGNQNLNYGFIQSASIYFSGYAIANSWASVPASADWSLGGDFTIETFLRPDGTPTDNFYKGANASRLFSIGYNYPSGGPASVVLELAFEANLSLYWLALNVNGTKYYFQTGGVNTDFSEFLGSWVHLAICRSGTTLRCFVNGVLRGQHTVVGSIGSAAEPLHIGGVGPNDAEYVQGPSVFKSVTGSLTNFRWINGSALYTAAFSPPTAELTPVPNTRLLLLANNQSQNPPIVGTIQDSSGTGKVVTRNPSAPTNNVVWTAVSAFPSPYGKANATDGNPNTIMVGALSCNAPDTNAKYTITTGFTAGTTISTLRIQNIPASSNFMRGSGFGNNEMTSTLLRTVNAYTESNVTVEYFSTIYLNSTTLQTFFF